MRDWTSAISALRERSFITLSTSESEYQKEDDQFDYHVIRIGVENINSHCNLSSQVKEIDAPPALNRINSIQCSFAQNAQCFIMNVIVTNQGIHDEFVREDIGKDTDATDEGGKDVEDGCVDST